MAARLTRSQRSNTPPKIVVQERDIDLLAALGKYRYLTTSNIQKLIFADKAKNALIRRLTKLYHTGFIDRLFTENLKSNAPGEACYFLDRPGYELIVSERGFEGRFQPKNKLVTPLFLNHTLAIIDFRIRLEASLVDNPVAYLPDDAWISEYDMADPYATKKKDKFIIYDEIYDPVSRTNLSFYPDALFVLHGKGQYDNYRSLYFLEIDRGTESSMKIKQKLRSYYLFRANNTFTKYAPVKSFIVLFVTTTQKRISALKDGLKDDPGLKCFLFTDLELIGTSNVVSAPIWLNHLDDYLSIIKS